METHRLVVLVQKHAVRKQLLDVSYFDRHLGTQVLAVNFYHGWVAVVVTPYLNAFLEEVEQSSSLEMQTLVFLHWMDWQREKVWSSWDVALEVHQHWVLRFEMVFNFVNGHHDLLVSVTHEERSNKSVVSLADRERSPVWKHQVEVFKLVPCIDHACHQSFCVQFLKSVVCLALAKRIKEYLYVWVNCLANVLFSHLFSKHFHASSNLRCNIVSVRVVHLLNT